MWEIWFGLEILLRKVRLLRNWVYVKIFDSGYRMERAGHTRRRCRRVGIATPPGNRWRRS